jgi:hypothetical protein
MLNCFVETTFRLGRHTHKNHSHFELLKIDQNRTKIVENAEKILFAPFSKVRL